MLDGHASAVNRAREEHKKTAGGMPAVLEIRCWKPD